MGAMGSKAEPATMAQTHMQGPMDVGSHGPVSKAQVAAVEEKVKALLAKNPELRLPERGHMDDVAESNWRFGSKPNYALANYYYLTGKKANHAEGSLEQVVENLVKTWEMERSHKKDPASHKTVDQKEFRISANGGKVYDNLSANQVGNYNVLLQNAPKELYDAEGMTWEQSHEAFHTAFPAFPWELLKVFSGPPVVAFSWRHWGTFTGSYKGNQGNGQIIEMYGFGIATVNADLQLCDVKLYYDSETFLKALAGDVSAKDTGVNTILGNVDKPYLQTKSACPFGFGNK